MPYVSPRGVVGSAKLHTAKVSTPSTSEYDSDSAGLFINPRRRRKELGELLEGRDADPVYVEMMESLSSWSGWSSPEVLDRNKDDEIDPLDDLSSSIETRLTLKDAVKNAEHSIANSPNTSDPDAISKHKGLQ